MKTQLEKAIEVAIVAHHGQLDKAGKPYILHPLRVGAAGKTEAEQIVGFLHDVLEDTKVTEAELRDLFDAELIDAVVSMTKREGETYRDFVKRSRFNPIGKEVKKNDLNDNLTPSRLSALDPVEQEGMSRRYKGALMMLELGRAADNVKL